MSVPFLTELLTAGLAAASAAGGYLIREYRNRLRPFFQVEAIEGAIAKLSDTVTLPEPLLAALKDGRILKDLTGSADLDDVSDRLKVADRLVSSAPAILAAIDRVSSGTDNAEFLTALRELFKKRNFDDWMVRLLVAGAFDPIPVTPDLTKSLAMWDDEDADGSVFIDFPGGACNFGNNFSTPAVKGKCEPFLKCITSVDKAVLSQILTKFRLILAAEHTAALRAAPLLKKIRNENSRWCFFIYFANLSQYPVVIENASTAILRDQQSGLRVTVPCYLALRESADAAKGEQLRDTSRPIVVAPGSGSSFALITHATQLQMPLGSAVREAYDRGAAQCRLRISILRVGLFKRQSFMSVWTPFVDTTN
jgi:hypothetical protein